MNLSRRGLLQSIGVAAMLAATRFYPATSALAPRLLGRTPEEMELVPVRMPRPMTISLDSYLPDPNSVRYVTLRRHQAEWLTKTLETDTSPLADLIAEAQKLP